MANDHVMTLDKQLAALEVTVAKGFQEQRQRLDKMDGRLDKMDGRLDKIDGRLDKIDGRLDKIDGRLDKVDGRLDKVDGRLDKVDGRLDKVDGRLDEHGRLLKEHTRRFDRLDDHISALDSKLDVVAESIHGEATTIRELVTGFIGEMQRTTDSIRKEHAADRRLTRLALFDQLTRIRTLEGGTPGTEN